MKRGDDSIQCGIHVRVLKARAEAETLLLVSFVDKSRVVSGIQYDPPRRHLRMKIIILRAADSSENSNQTAKNWEA